MIAKKKEKVRLSRRHRLLTLAVALCCVFLFMAVSVKSIQYTRSIRREYQDWGIESLCTQLDNSDYITTHGWVMKSYVIEENNCLGSVRTVSPVGVAVNMLPGAAVAAALLLFYSYYMRRSVR